MSDEPHDKKKKEGFQPLGGIFNDLQGRLFDSLLDEPEEPEAAPIVVTKVKKAPASRAKLLAAAGAIASRPPDKNKGEIVYTMPELVQCNFPIRDPGNVASWTRKNGNLSLIIQPGIDPKTGESLGISRGEWPRLIMKFFQKQAVITNQQNIKLGTTSNEFIRLAGGNPETGGGKRGDAKRLETEFRRLIYSRISYIYKEGTAQKGREAFVNMEVAKSGQLWWDFKHPDQTSFFASEIVLGDTLFQAFINDPIPVDFRVLMALKHSLKQASFAMDIHDWQQRQIYRMRKKGIADVKINWTYLPEQFGAEFTRARDWKASFDENFLHVEAVSPISTHEFEGNYLIIRDTDTRAGVQNALPSRRRMEKLANQISPKSRDWFFSSFPLHASQLNEVEDAFNSWREKEGISSRDPDRHFESFVRYNWFKQTKPQGR